MRQPYLRRHHIAGRVTAFAVAAASVAIVASHAQSAPAPPAGSEVTSLHFDPSGTTVAVAHADGSVGVVNAADGTARWTALHGGPQVAVNGITFVAGERVASVGGDSVVRLWDAATGAAGPVLEGHEAAASAVASSPDGSFLVTGGEDTRAMVWDAATGKLSLVLAGHNRAVRAVAVSPDGATIATAGDDGMIILWDTAGKQRALLRGHAGPVTGVAFGDRGRSLSSSSTDGTERIWRVSDGQQLRVIRPGSKALRAAAAFTDGLVYATGGDDNRVSLWNGSTGAALCSVPSNSPVTAIDISDDGLTAASANQAGQVAVFSVASCALQRTLSGVGEAADAGASSSAPSEAAPSEATAAAAFSDPGPGGPILVVTVAGDPFSGYYTEILRNEGFNEFNVIDVSALDAAALAPYDVVVLAASDITAQRAVDLEAWVNAGGNLIASRPDVDLRTLAGLSGAAGTLSNAYLRVDTTTGPGAGIVGDTIQYHGDADRYSLNSGTAAIATLYSNATTSANQPAVTLRSVGANGGQVATFTYDLARSIVYTRQGNPAWAGQERDGTTPIRSDDLYFGAAANDPQADWVDLDKIAIPQADEQQRLLANLVVQMNLDKKPLPRFWYFPNGKKAAIVMTGDDHGNGGTAGRFDQYVAQSPPGCSVANWECIRSTSYIYPNTPLTSTQVANYTAQGFEIALHLNTSCADYTPASLGAAFDTQLAQFAGAFPSVPAPRTNRTHCIAWSDWASKSLAEVSRGIRLNTDYYYWPPGWVNNRPGFFTGSGMPMRVANSDGSLIDVYEAATQMTDESGQTYPFNPSTLLDKALGAEGYYGAFTVNAHTDSASSSVSDGVVSSALARGVPIVSSAQMLTWLDGRNSSSFSNIAWAGNTLSFTAHAGAGATGLQTMIPMRAGNLIVGRRLRLRVGPRAGRLVPGRLRARHHCADGRVDISGRRCDGCRLVDRGHRNLQRSDRCDDDQRHDVHAAGRYDRRARDGDLRHRDADGSIAAQQRARALDRLHRHVGRWSDRPAGEGRRRERAGR
jgi:WD40 repeat protein